MFQEHLAFYGKCLWSSWVQVWGRSGILREMHFTFVCNVFQERLAFALNAFYCRVSSVSRAYGILREMPFIVLNLWLRRMWEMPLIVVCNVIQDRLAFCVKCQLSPFLMCFNSVYHFTGNAFERPESMFEERLAFCRKSLWSSWVYVWGASGFLDKCLLSSFVICLKSVWHLSRTAFDHLQFMFKERLAFCGKCLLSSCVMCLKTVGHFEWNAFDRRVSCV